MAYEATPAWAGAIAAARRSEALRVAWKVAWTTRLGVLLVAIFAALSFGPALGGLAAENERKFDEPALTHALADPLLSPLARWDAVWYLRIADSGYGGSHARAAFFPLYPLLVRALATPFGGSEAALLVAAYLVALAAFLAALALLHRLVSLELGRPLARPTLLLLAVFPAAVFFGAPYAESLFLALAVGAFWTARTGRWAWAGACLAGAAATRSAGILLLVPLAMIWWSAPRRSARQLAWLALGPLGLGAYALFLGLAEGDALRFLDVQDAWSRELTVPLLGAWDGAAAAWDGLRQLASGQKEIVYFEVAAGDPYRIAAINLLLFAHADFRRGRLRGRVCGGSRRLRDLGGALAAAAVDVPGAAAAADVAAPLRLRPVPDLHVAGALERGAARHRAGGGAFGAGPGPVHGAVRLLALDLVTRAVLLDALGTLVELQPPAPRLRRLLAARRASPCPRSAPPPASARRSPTTSSTTSREPIGSRSTICATAARRSCARRSGCPGSTTQRPGGRCWRRSSSAPFPTWRPASPSCGRAAWRS